MYPAYELRFYSTRKASRALFRLVFSENFCLPLFSEDVNIKGAGDDEVLLQEFAFEKLTISDCTPQIFPLVLLSDIVRYFRNQEKRTCQFSSFPPLICHNCLNADFPEQGLKGRRFNCPQFCDAKNTGNMSQVTKCYTYGRDMTNINPETSNRTIFIKCQIESAFRSTNLFLIDALSVYLLLFTYQYKLTKLKVKKNGAFLTIFDHGR